ncbi:MAG: signal recognition particle protein [Arenicellales bacterium]|nr:signal recognition particle protein [Arenicellales bacterium]MDP6725404.1 signal recognition particle protein [Arenicellales bacterium]
MFDQLADRLKTTLSSLTARGRLTEENIKEALRGVRIALLEADVALPVAKAFIGRVRERAIGQEVMEGLNPGQAVITVVQKELESLMGGESEPLNLKSRPPVVIMVAGLQGAGKTTTVAKLAKRLKERDRKRVMVASVDIYRPAAIDQLEKLASEIEVGFHSVSSGQNAVAIATAAVEAAKRRVMDILILDTAGRLHIDQEMMLELQSVHEATTPTETLFVVDSLTGQDAVNSAKIFDEALPLSGVVLTKTDGDARGGAALSIRQVTGKPIKFLGIGEALDAIEPFHPERVASRILGMGDILSLVEEVERKVDRKKSEKLVKKIKKGKGFDLNDFREQLQQMESMGGIGSMVEKLPGMGNLPRGTLDRAKGGESRHVIAIINSMTLQERQFPALIKASRKKRIASGSGVQVQEVNRLLKQFQQMQKMMKKMKGGKNMARMMAGMKEKMGSGMPF